MSTPENPNAVAVAQPSAIEAPEAFATRLEQFGRLAEGVVKARLAPKGMDAAGVMVAMQTGHELGLAPMQSLKAIHVINGRAGLGGESALGLIRGRGVLKPGTDLEIRYEGEGDAMRCFVALWRRGADEPVSQSFSVGEAKRARLWGKSGPWSEYPRRMLMWRAMGFLLRDFFSDVTMGLALQEELRDIPAAVAATNYSDPPEDPTTDPLLAAAMGQEDVLEAAEAPEQPADPIEDAQIIPPAGEEPAQSLPESREEDTTPEPGTKEFTCGCGSKDDYPLGGTSECTAECGRVIFLNSSGTGFANGWMEGKGPGKDRCHGWCDLEEGHEGNCEAIPEGPPPPPPPAAEEPEAPSEPEPPEEEAPKQRELKCKCGTVTLVVKGTPSPVSCAKPECNRRFRRITRGQNKGDIVNEKDPEWEPPPPAPDEGANQEPML